jgi:hypothetical protein
MLFTTQGISEVGSFAAGDSVEARSAGGRFYPGVIKCITTRDSGKHYVVVYDHAAIGKAEVSEGDLRKDYWSERKRFREPRLLNFRPRVPG